MRIVVSSLHLKDYAKLEEYAKKKISKLAKYFPKILQADIRLIANKAHRGQEQDYSCEIKLVIPGKDLELTDTERAMDKAIDKAAERAKRLLIRAKEKKISLKHKEGILAKSGRSY